MTIHHYSGDERRTKEREDAEALVEMKELLRAIALVMGIDHKDQRSILKARATFQFIENMHASRTAMVARASITTIGLLITGIGVLIVKGLGLGSLLGNH